MARKKDSDKDDEKNDKSAERLALLGGSEKKLKPTPRRKP